MSAYLGWCRLHSTRVETTPSGVTTIVMLCRIQLSTEQYVMKTLDAAHTSSSKIWPTLRDPQLHRSTPKRRRTPAFGKARNGGIDNPSRPRPGIPNTNGSSSNLSSLGCCESRGPGTHDRHKPGLSNVIDILFRSILYTTKGYIISLSGSDGTGIRGVVYRDYLITLLSFLCL